jgi:hypothetical protein
MINECEEHNVTSVTKQFVVETFYTANSYHRRYQSPYYVHYVYEISQAFSPHFHCELPTVFHFTVLLQSELT